MNTELKKIIKYLEQRNNPPQIFGHRNRGVDRINNKRIDLAVIRDVKYYETWIEETNRGDK